METVSIGRRVVNKDVFINTVQSSKGLTETCEKLGFNSTVPTTFKAIKEQISILGIDTSHFAVSLNRTHSEKFDKYLEGKIKQFNLSADNQIYYDKFEKSMKPESFPTYKASIGNFMEQLKDEDFACVDLLTIDKFTRTGNTINKESHIRSLMTYIVANNINNAREKVDKEILIWLISNRAKKIS